MKRNQQYIKSLLYYFIFIFCVICFYKWDETDRIATREYLEDNIPSRYELNGPPLESDINDEYKINPGYTICEQNEQDILFIAYVVIAPSFFEKRNLIRSTYGQNTSNFKLIFAMAMSNDKKVNEKIQEESNLYKDILQIASIKDSYYKLTKKVMKTFRWLSHYCSNVKYVLHLNDDVVLNKNNLIDYFEKITYQRNQIYGNLIKGSYPNRDITSKFYVKWSEYGLKKYPWYVDGKCSFELILNYFKMSIDVGSLI